MSELLKQNSKSEESKVCEVKKFQPKTYGWKVKERYDGLRVDRHDELSTLEVMIEGNWAKLADIDNFLQIKAFITANNNRDIYTFVRSNGIYLNIEASAIVKYAGGLEFLVYEHPEGIVVFFFNSKKEIIAWRRFRIGYRKNGNWYFENETAVYKISVAEIAGGYWLKLSFSHYLPRKRWYWPFWKL